MSRTFELSEFQAASLLEIGCTEIELENGKLLTELQAVSENRRDWVFLSRDVEEGTFLVEITKDGVEAAKAALRLTAWMRKQMLMNEVRDAIEAAS